MVLDNFFNFIFSFAIKLGAPWSIIIISFVITLIMSLATKYLTDQTEMKSLKEELQHLQKEIKSNQDNPSKAQEIQKRLIDTNMKYMKQSFKPMLYTFLPIIIFFGWLKSLYPTGDIINFGFNIPLFGMGLGWLGTYIISSIIFSLIIRKLFKIH
jgi:uncharacterized membrane protein (DUF106 family)